MRCDAMRESEMERAKLKCGLQNRLRQKPASLRCFSSACFDLVSRSGAKSLAQSTT